jgi:hypothetical protein
MNSEYPMSACVVPYASALSLIDVTYKLVGKVFFNFQPIAKKHEIFLFFPWFKLKKCQL